LSAKNARQVSPSKNFAQNTGKRAPNLPAPRRRHGRPPGRGAAAASATLRPRSRRRQVQPAFMFW